MATATRVMLTKTELAEALKISMMSVNRHMKKGMPYYKVGELVRFDLDEVLDWFKGSN